MMSSLLSQPLPGTKHTTLKLITPHVLLVTLARPPQNFLNEGASEELERVFNYVEQEPALLCSIASRTPNTNITNEGVVDRIW